MVKSSVYWVTMSTHPLIFPLFEERMAELASPLRRSKVLEQNFYSWFSVPSNLDPAALAIEEDQALYQELVDPPPHIKRAHG